MRKRFLIRRASPSDLQTIVQLIDNAAAWLRDKGSDQWSRPWPTREARDRRVLDGLRAGKTWIVWDRETPAATISVDCEGNPKLWTAAELQDTAVYAHRLVINRQYAGSGLGAELMDWAGLRARQEWGASLIRIDVWTTNTRLQHYYRSQRFLMLRLCSDPTYPAGVLMEKPISRIERQTLPFEHEVAQRPDLLDHLWTDVHPLRHLIAPARQGAVPAERLAACAVHRRPPVREGNDALAERMQRPVLARPPKPSPGACFH